MQQQQQHTHHGSRSSKTEVYLMRIQVAQHSYRVQSTAYISALCFRIHSVCSQAFSCTAASSVVHALPWWRMHMASFVSEPESGNFMQRCLSGLPLQCQGLPCLQDWQQV
jgi:hypothetical protein